MQMQVYNPLTEAMLDDMIITRSEYKRLMFGHIHNRNAITDPNAIWRDKTIRFFIDSEYNEKEREVILKGTQMIASASCIKFVQLDKPPTDNTSYVHINSLSGCYSKVGGNCVKCRMSLSTVGSLK
jgi:hypothetical protein